jgi:hypothetical protein
MPFESQPFVKMEQITFTKVKNRFSDLLRWRKAIRFIRRLVFSFLTFTYSGAYKHHTRVPIQAIAARQDYLQDKAETIGALAQFRQLKTEELRFVQGAVTLPARSSVIEANSFNQGNVIWCSSNRSVLLAHNRKCNMGN